MSKSKIWMSSPHMGTKELELVKQAFATNWIAPQGPEVDAFESEFAAAVGAKHAVAVSSGTAALHLALRFAGVSSGDEVICPTLTFVATVSPILYLQGIPVFVDSDARDWNLSPEKLEAFLKQRAKANRVPKFLVVVHLYGQSANLKAICELCRQYDIRMVEDAAEALGASYQGRSPGTFGDAGIFSFNGNKIITTSGGGMIVSDNQDQIAKCRFWATQARDPAPYYQHSEIGYNYRMSNILAAIGRGQLEVLAARVEARRANFKFYQDALAGLAGLAFQPDAGYGTCTRWLSCITIDSTLAKVTPDEVRLALAAENIEARPVWKPMHLQPALSQYEYSGGTVAESLFACGLCLPSGSNLSQLDLHRVVQAIHACWAK